MTTLVANHHRIIPMTCGVGEVGWFRKEGGPVWDGKKLASLKPSGGAGWMIAGFTNSLAHGDTYEQAYELLKKRWTIVYQSPVRKNKRTGHQFFFCIYDTTQKGN
jgi:hypothetical protein